MLKLNFICDSYLYHQRHTECSIDHRIFKVGHSLPFVLYWVGTACILYFYHYILV